MAANSYHGPEYGRPLNGAGVRRISRSADERNGKKSKLRTNSIRIGTWNVQSMYDGKLENTIAEMTRLNIPILGISEMRWPGTGLQRLETHTVFWPGEAANYHRNGVAFIVSNDLQKSVVGFLPVSDRVALLQIKASPCSITFIQVYAPTSAADDVEMDRFYNDVNECVKAAKHDVVILMGDLNAKVGAGRVGEVVGDFGLGVRNERGDRSRQKKKKIRTPRKMWKECRVGKNGKKTPGPNSLLLFFLSIFVRGE